MYLNIGGEIELYKNLTARKTAYDRTRLPTNDPNLGVEAEFVLSQVVDVVCITLFL